MKSLFFFGKTGILMIPTPEMIAENVKILRAQIAAACARAHRDENEITLIAVTKTLCAGQIRDAMAAGVRDFGENYVQELRQKQAELSDQDIRWHFIGHLQTNKAKHVAGSVALIHTVDSVHLGKELSKHAQQSGRPVRVFVEVNTSGEKSKFGVPPGAAGDLVNSLRSLPGVSVDGLMTIGPFLPDPEQSRPAFRLLRGLKSSIEAASGTPLPHLSMGMSNDFLVAVEEGATMVRIGTAIFGPRPKQ